MSMKLSAVEQFLSNINEERKAKGSSYECWIWNRGQKGCRGQNLYWVGPKTEPEEKYSSRRALRICRKHNTGVYEPAHQELINQLRADHKNGFHGEGDDRIPFAEVHSDTSGYFELKCGDCVDEMASEELGVEPDQVAEAQSIKDKMAAAQLDYENAVARFDSLWAAGKHAFAITRHGAQVTQASAVHDMYKRVLFFMEMDESNMVVAYGKVVDEVKSKLISDSYGDDDERRAASRFVKGDRYW